MSRHIFFIFTVVAVVAYLGTPRDIAGAADSRRADTKTQSIVAATTAFLNALSPEQRDQVRFAFENQTVAKEVRFARTGRPGGPGGLGGGGSPPGGMPRQQPDGRGND